MDFAHQIDADDSENQDSQTKGDFGHRGSPLLAGVVWGGMARRQDKEWGETLRRSLSRLYLENV